MIFNLNTYVVLYRMHPTKTELYVQFTSPLSISRAKYRTKVCQTWFGFNVLMSMADVDQLGANIVHNEPVCVKPEQC